MNPPLIEISDLTVKIGSKKILKGITLTIRRGDFLCIVGPNGAGKTTFLKCLNRLLENTQGDIIIAGRPLEDYPQRELATLMSYVPQADERHLPFTVYEFVMMGRYPHLSPFSSITEEDERAARRAMALAGCTNEASRPLNSLSGGERQKAFVAAALAQGAKILLLDEPTTFLDPKHQAEIYRTLKTLNEESGITIILVTHDINLGASFGRTIVAIKEGVVTFDGPSAEFMKASILESLYDIRFSFIKTPSGRSFAIQEELG